MMNKNQVTKGVISFVKWKKQIHLQADWFQGSVHVENEVGKLNRDLLKFSLLMYPLGSQAHSGLKIAAIAPGMTLVGY